MKRADVRRIVEDFLEEKRKLFALDEWIIHKQFVRLPPGVNACVNLEDAAYKTATISFDPVNIEDHDHVVECLEHELIHVMLADFYLYRRIYGNIKSVGEAGRKEQELCTWTEERMVRAVERLLERIRGDER